MHSNKYVLNLIFYYHHNFNIYNSLEEIIEFNYVSKPSDFVRSFDDGYNVSTDLYSPVYRDYEPFKNNFKIWTVNSNDNTIICIDDEKHTLHLYYKRKYLYIRLQTVHCSYNVPKFCQDLHNFRYIIKTKDKLFCTDVCIYYIMAQFSNIVVSI